MACRRTIVASLVGLALFVGCSEQPYTKQDGAWRYDGSAITVRHPDGLQPLGAKGEPTAVFARDGEVAYFRGEEIEGSHGPSFVPMDGHYARDTARAYYCDTYRKGQEYYTAKHNAIVVIDSVSLVSFRLMAHGYARDSTRLYFEGRHVRVRDIASFELLEDGYQRDRVTGYYERRPIEGSDGRTFQVLSAGYSRDASSVFFTRYRDADPAELGKTVRVSGASPADFVVKEASYAVDGKRVYHDGRVIATDVAGFAVLGIVYARAGGTVFHDGRPVEGADAATFTVLERDDGVADARDARRRYRRGVAVAE
jgi:DKNYY family